MRRLLIPFLLAASLLAACGGGGSGTAAAPVAGKSASRAVAVSPGAATSTTTTSVPTFSGNSGSSWCDLVRSLQDHTKFESLYKDPHAWVAAVNDLIPQVSSRAPGAIRGDVHTLVGGLRAYMQAVVAAGYDFHKLSTAQLAGLADANFAAASERITAYDTQVCGTKG
jgi:hypothetical protein